MKLGVNSLKSFGRFFSKKQNSPKNEISVDQFFNHFKDLASNDIQNEDEVETFLRNFDSVNPQIEATSCFEELDKRITQDEIRRSVKNLSRNKSPGGDN